MNRYQAEIVCRLPDGYNYEFLTNGKYVIGYKDRGVILFRIVGDELIQEKIKDEPKA